MGAPGDALFCAKGHLFGWVNRIGGGDEERTLREMAKYDSTCPCGDQIVLRAMHYGRLDDLESGDFSAPVLFQGIELVVVSPPPEGHTASYADMVPLLVFCVCALLEEYAARN